MTREAESLSPIQERFAETVKDLLVLHRLLTRTAAPKRHAIYAQCIPLLSAVNALNKHPLPVRKITAAAREIDWHLRSLAGLATGKVGTDDDHSAWALGGLELLARYAQLTGESC